MEFTQPFHAIRLRSVALCVAGVSVAAATSFLFYRWRVQDRQQTDIGAAAHTDPCDQPEDREPFPTDHDMFETPCSPVPKPDHAVHSAHRVFDCTFTQEFSTGAQMVVVKLQHKAVYSGLESEHWWVLIKEFCFAQFPLLPIARVNAVAYIKRRESRITEATIYLRTESTKTWVQNSFLISKMSTTCKGVSIDSAGLYAPYESSHSQSLETPQPDVFCSTPPPPPGF